MSLKYITVKEFSERAEVTPQAVYKRIKTDLKPYTKKIDNKIMVNVEGLKQFEPQEEEAETTEKTMQTHTEGHESDTNDLLNVIKTLNKIINDQALQIEDKDREIRLLKESQETKKAQGIETSNKAIEALRSTNEILEEQLKQREVELTEVKGWLSQSLRIAEQTNFITAQRRLQEPEESTDIIPEDVQESATQSDTEAPQVKPWYRRLFNRK